jgi:hypothetical protein
MSEPSPAEAAMELMRRQVTALAERVNLLEGACASLNHGVSCFKPLPLARHPALAEIVASVAARTDGQGTPYVLPEHHQVEGRVA